MEHVSQLYILFLSLIFPSILHGIFCNIDRERVREPAKLLLMLNA